MKYLLLIFLSHTAFAASFAPVRMMVQPGDNVEVRGFRGSVEYAVKPDATDITVEVRQPSLEPRQPASAPGAATTAATQAAAKIVPYQDEWQFSFKREGNTIQAFVEGPSSKQIWNEVLVSGAIPEFNLKITGPSLPLNINWNEGRINIPNLDADLKITSIKADVNVSKGTGPLMIMNQEGAVTVRERKGEVRVDSYLAKVDIDNIEGRLDLENFTGDSKVNNINGNLYLSTYKGNTKVTEVKGRLEFKNGNAPLHIEKFEGELRGRSAQGAVFADIRGDANVRVESAEGAVNLRLPASGAWVNVGTEEGSLAVPNFLKLTRVSSQEIRTGRLKGATGGSVFVRTTSGDIVVR